MEKNYSFFDLISLWDEDFELQQNELDCSNDEFSPSKKVISDILAYALSSTIIYSPCLDKKIELWLN